METCLDAVFKLIKEYCLCYFALSLHGVINSPQVIISRVQLLLIQYNDILFCEIIRYFVCMSLIQLDMN